MAATTTDRIGTLLAQRLPAAHPDLRSAWVEVLAQLPEVAEGARVRAEIEGAANELEAASAALRANNAPGPAEAASESAGRLRDWLA